jgi:CRP/FNR family cyclic AMP-dependent transcriptional regulator
VLSGRLKVMMSDAEGKEVILSILGPGEFFGEMGLIDDEPRSATVVTIEPCELLSIAKREFKKSLAENFDMSMAVMRGLVRRLREADRKIGSLALLDVYGRVARLLLDMAENVDGEKVVTKRLPKQDIAKMIGASREMVSRVMKDLQTGGYIECAAPHRAARHDHAAGVMEANLAVASKSGAPLPAKLAGLLREAKWLLLIAAGLYLLPHPRHVSPLGPGLVAQRDRGGHAQRRRGLRRLAVRPDALSVWPVGLLVGRACLYLVVWGLAPDGWLPPRRGAGRLRLAAALSACLERLRLHSLAAALPLAPGGVAGDSLADVLSRGSALPAPPLALLTLGAIGWSLFIGVSWLTIFEGLGHAARERLLSAARRLGAPP